METKKILFIEDDMIVGSLVTRGLENAGYKVLFMNSLDNFRQTLTDQLPDLILLDLEVNNKNSSDELPFIRSVYPSLPVIIASSHISGKEIGYCLDAGVSYYIKKPYELEELLPLIHRFCPDIKDTAPNSISFGKYHLQTDNHQLFFGEKHVQTLNPKEFSLLSLLLSKPGEIVERSEILQQIWQNENAGDSLNNYITYLRNYLKQDPDIEIKTVKKIGYSFILLKGN